MNKYKFMSKGYMDAFFFGYRVTYKREPVSIPKPRYINMRRAADMSILKFLHTRRISRRWGK